jgi:ribonuclease P protein component
VKGTRRGSARFGRDRRLHQGSQFAAVYQRGHRWTHPLLVLRALPNGLAQSRFGFSVGRRVGNAVVRNRVRRRLREVARLTPVSEGWDLVFITRPATAGVDYWKWKEAAQQLLQRAGLLLPQRRGEQEG